DELASFIEPVPGDPPTVLLSELTANATRGGADRFEPVPHDESALAVLQFTSGSTSDPKGVMLPHAQVLANLDAAAEAGHLHVERDVIVSWLPLYHDMG